MHREKKKRKRKRKKALPYSRESKRDNMSRDGVERNGICLRVSGACKPRVLDDGNDRGVSVDPLLTARVLKRKSAFVE